MRIFLTCVAETLVEIGVKPLMAEVSGGALFCEMAQRAYDRYQGRCQDAQIQRQEIEQLANVKLHTMKNAALEAVGGILCSEDDGRVIQFYLMEIPGVVRQSQRRSSDPSGCTLRSEFSLANAQDMAKLLPSDLPKFVPSEEKDSSASHWGYYRLFRRVSSEHYLLPQPATHPVMPDPSHRYTKISEEGVFLPADAEVWAGVYDKTTDLWWEAHTSREKYSWADIGNRMSEVNWTGLCGHYDWRVPEIHELKSLVIKENKPTVDNEYFPNTPASYFWSVVRGPNNFGYTWLLSFCDGYTHYGDYNHYEEFVWLVRGPLRVVTGGYPFID